MAKCKYVYETLWFTELPESRPGPSQVRVRCEVHNWIWPDGSPVATSRPRRLPIRGKVE